MYLFYWCRLVIYLVTLVLGGLAIYNAEDEKSRGITLSVALICVAANEWLAYPIWLVIDAIVELMIQLFIISALCLLFLKWVRSR